jgi:predicted nucleic acid-binding protein
MIFDASSLFNLHNGELFPVLVMLPRVDILFGPQVRQECRSIASSLDQLLLDGAAKLLDDDDLAFGRFAELAIRYELGPGETECLVFAESLGCTVCCDDGRARKMISREIGDDRLTGTIGLIQMACAHGILSDAQARSAHSLMIARGGFLPSLPPAAGAAEPTWRNRTS